MPMCTVLCKLSKVTVLCTKSDLEGIIILILWPYILYCFLWVSFYAVTLPCSIRRLRSTVLYQISDAFNSQGKVS